ncbi:hypothetical protein EYF80_038286 [Liparis tanakae]|uniref:Uncharacterized protein n=1 Tax=Liparis tanakae TaxID=230148 RepID=A0A4Z2GFJ9_9TELE|nr:hypothetical protein EYF80_038286 [Liparis tanakae]
MWQAPQQTSGSSVPSATCIICSVSQCGAMMRVCPAPGAHLRGGTVGSHGSSPVTLPERKPLGCQQKIASSYLGVCPQSR